MFSLFKLIFEMQIRLGESERQCVPDLHESMFPAKYSKVFLASIVESF